MSTLAQEVEALERRLAERVAAFDQRLAAHNQFGDYFLEAIERAGELFNASDPITAADKYLALCDSIKEMYRVGSEGMR